MSRPMQLSRDEAEFLVNLIEASGAYANLSDELREQWGMCHVKDDTSKRDFCPCCGRDLTKVD